MHYSNGRIARVGDVVRGKGYNIKHEIIGLMTRINTGSESCNCEVACISVNSFVFVYALPNGVYNLPGYSTRYGYDGTNSSNTSYRVEPTIEYGQCDAFVALDPKTGEVLLEEEPKNKS